MRRCHKHAAGRDDAGWSELKWFASAASGFGRGDRLTVHIEYAFVFGDPVARDAHDMFAKGLWFLAEMLFEKRRRRRIEQYDIAALRLGTAVEPYRPVRQARRDVDHQRMVTGKSRETGKGKRNCAHPRPDCEPTR